MDLKAGKATADSGAYVGLIKAAAGTTAEEKNGGVFVIPTNAVVAEDGNGVSVAVAESLGYTVETVDEVQVFTPSPAKADKTYFAIYDMTTLRAYRTAINNGTEILLAKVTADFSMSEEDWDPIGTNEHPFYGVFDGQGHTVDGLNSTTSGIWWQNNSTGYGQIFGFFGVATGGDVTIKNINFTNVDINYPNDGKNMGIVLGYSKAGSHSVTFENITIGSSDTDESSSLVANSHAGSLAGKIYSSGSITIKNCNNYATITGKGGYLGSMVGYANAMSELNMENCHNYGDIIGTNANGVSGLFGWAANSSTAVVEIKNCSNDGDISNNYSGSNYPAAGLVYLNAKEATIENCVNNGNVSTTGTSIAVGVVNFGEGTASTRLKGKIENTGDVSTLGNAHGLAVVANNKTLTIEKAELVNTGNISGKIAGGFMANEQGIKFVSVGSSTFENKGNITATATSGFAYAGGVFGYVEGAIEGYNTIPFSINVHNCTITASGEGLNEKFSSAGGVVGQIDGKGFSFNNVVVKNVTISALGQNDNTYNYAGGFVGMLRVNGQTNKVSVLTNADISTGMTITASHNGTVAGCAYDSQGGSYKNALNYSGSFGSGNALGYSWNNGTITALSE